MVRKAKVVVLAVSGRNNKVHRLHDEVNENQFVAGRFDELVKGGYIKVIGVDEKQVKNLPEEQEVEIIKKPVDDTPEGVKQAEAAKNETINPDVDDKHKQVTLDDVSKGIMSGIAPKDEKPNQPPANGATENKGDVDDVTRKEIMGDLDKLKVVYDKNASKLELYTLWKEATKK
jgi:hypothetical protein